MTRDIVQELCESRGGRPGLSVLTSLLVSVDVKIYWTVLRHWLLSWCLMSSDVIWHIRDKLWPMPKHGSIRKVYACLAVTCHLHFWQNDRDFLRATVVTRGWNGYRNKSQHRKSTLEKKILPPFQQGFEPATFQSRVRRSNHWAIPAPGIGHNLSLICQLTSEDIKHQLIIMWPVIVSQFGLAVRR